MELLKKLERAINHSESHNETVDVDAHGFTDADVIALINYITCDMTDYVMIEDGVMDIWGWTDQTPEDDQDWRLHVSFSG